MRQTERLGLLGGTFDPVHAGHLQVALTVRQTLALDAIWFIPAAMPPHKSRHACGLSISSYEHRAAMLELALAGQRGFRVSRLEAELPRPSYTIETLQALKKRVAGPPKLYFIIGSDAFAEIPTWRQFDRLVLLADFVVIKRPDFPFARVAEIIARHFPAWCYDAGSSRWHPPGEAGSIHFLELSPIPVSSTLIRARVRAGEAIDGLVPDSVAEYIRVHGLYV